MTASEPLTFYDKPLFKLISATFPEFVTPQGVFGVGKFGAAIGMSPEGVYKWFRANRMTPDGALKVVELSRVGKTDNFRLTKEQLYAFCFPG